MDSPQNSEIGMESIGQSDTTPDTDEEEPDEEAAVDDADSLEIEISVEGETFDTMDDARTFVAEQKKQQAIEDVREELQNIWGDNADERLIETVSPEGETMSFDAIVRHLLSTSDLVSNLNSASPRVAAGGVMLEFGKQYANDSFKFE